MKGKLKPTAQKVLAYMMWNGSITGREAQEEIGTTELRSRISEIKRAGYNVKSCFIEGTNKYGEPVRYKKYWLEGAEENDEN